MMLFLLYIPVGLIGGMIMSCLGLGAGLITVPILFFGLGYLHLPLDITMRMTLGTSFILMLFNGLNATFLHHKKGSIHWPITRKLFLYIVIGALIGILIGNYVNGNVLRYLFIAYIIYTIYKTIYKKEEIYSNDISDSHVIEIPHSMKMVTFGLLSGSFSAMLGIGGSVFTIPFLRSKRFSLHSCIAMAAALTLPVSIIGTFGYIIAGLNVTTLPLYSLGYIYWPAALSLLLGGAIGIHVGTHIAYRLSEQTLLKLYLLLLVIGLIMMIIK